MKPMTDDIQNAPIIAKTVDRRSHKRKASDED